MAFRNQKELDQFCEERAKSAEPMRQRLATTVGIDGCYYHAVQWLNDNTVRFSDTTTGRKMLPTSFSPDTAKIRVIANITSRLIQKAAAGTEPQRMFCDCIPPERNLSMEAAISALAHESLANELIERTGLLETVVEAQFRRCVAGSWGIGLGVRTRPRQVGNDVESGSELFTFDFEPTRLILDPFVQKRDLTKHDYVIYQTVWTMRKFQRMFPKVKIDPEKTKKIREMEAEKVRIGQITSGRMYGSYVHFSETPGVLVQQVHERDASGRFPIMYVRAEIDGEWRTINWDDPSSPFRGRTGLPFTMLYGHQGFDSMWGISDVSMIRAEQDKINLGETAWWRQVLRSAGAQWLVDRRAFGTRATDDEIARKFSNMVWSVIPLDLSDRNRNVQYPQLVQHPSPMPQITDHTAINTDRARENVHRAEGHFGETKTHVTASNFDRALNEAADVFDARIRDDVRRYASFIETVLATGVGLLQGGDPVTASIVASAGFSPDDLAPIMQSNPDELPVKVVVRDSAIRHRSHRERQQQVDRALERGALDGQTYRDILAETLESPLSEDDRLMHEEANRAALSVSLGMEWVPVSLGEHTNKFISAFRRAMWSGPRKNDPAARQRLEVAISSQRQHRTQELLESDPTYAAQQQQAQSQAQPAQPGPTDTVSVADLIGLLSGGGQPASAVPA